MTPAGRVFLTIWYGAGVAALVWATIYVEPIFGRLTGAWLDWLIATFGFGPGILLDYLCIIVPLGILWYFFFWRPRW